MRHGWIMVGVGQLIMRKLLVLGDYVEVRAEALVVLSNMTRRFQC